METSQIVIERSLYASLLRVALKLNRTINPEDFQPISSKSQMMQERAIKALGNKYIGIYGVGNNQSRGIKQVPRITIDLTAYYPGDLGVEQIMNNMLYMNSHLKLRILCLIYTWWLIILRI